MRFTMKKVIVIFCIIGEFAFSQMMPKWEVTFSGREMEKLFGRSIDPSDLQVFGGRHSLFLDLPSSSTSNRYDAFNPVYIFVDNGSDTFVTRIGYDVNQCLPLE